MVELLQHLQLVADTILNTHTDDLTTVTICCATTLHLDFSVHIYWGAVDNLTLPNSQRAMIPQTPTTPSLATGRGTVAGTRLAALLVTPLASLRIAACWHVWYRNNFIAKWRNTRE